jgi:hypothetical protein
MLSWINVKLDLSLSLFWGANIDSECLERSAGEAIRIQDRWSSKDWRNWICRNIAIKVGLWTTRWTLNIVKEHL